MFLLGLRGPSLRPRPRLRAGLRERWAGPVQGAWLGRTASPPTPRPRGRSIAPSSTAKRGANEPPRTPLREVIPSLRGAENKSPGPVHGGGAARGAAWTPSLPFISLWAVTPACCSSGSSLLVGTGPSVTSRLLSGWGRKDGRESWVNWKSHFCPSQFFLAWRQQRAY